jgi:hypothetical protein
MSLKEVLRRLHRPSPRRAGAPHRASPGEDRARLEVLEGYLIVYLNLDKVIRIIRTEDEPKPKLMKAFKLTERRPKRSSTCGCAPCASSRRWKSAASTRPDQGAEGAEEAARFRQAEIRAPDRGSEGDRREVRPEDRARQAPHDLRRAAAISPPTSTRWKPGRARADHGRLLGEGLAALVQGPSGAERRRSNIAKATASGSGFMPRRPTS